MYPVEAEIDYKKLIFLGQLCRLPGGYKEIFTHRLIHFSESPAKKLGFFPDIFRILNKLYSLSLSLVMCVCVCVCVCVCFSG